ncbi:hypothetical protein CYLTODRAFT_467192 [Cylindrobasidium torrendii FP15055 ss-10]|uniref:Uncharacterized protein n=1 Tax=Cylindrobasidium torrendii FP15055 ss-10 TaxID=1314674 RepID=A0A0D7B5R6_9AGAR|nr:hypothetical protein CYLTODRAFT_467192 [Cylindrobasidium torrendii FP15055 ss-10]
MMAEPTDAFLKSNPPDFPWIPRLFNSNEVPSADERRKLEDVLPRLTNEAAQLEEEIAALKERHSKIMGKVHGIQSALHPQRVIPDDILREIFAFCVPWCFETPSELVPLPLESSTDASEPPWTLSQVCRNWRAVALSCPHLWSAVQIEYSATLLDQCNRHPTSWADRLALISSWSAPLPLRVHILSYQYIHYLEHSWDTSGLDKERWQTLYMQGTSHLISSTIAEQPFPLLTDLSLDYQSAFWESFHCQLPALRRLEQHNRLASRFGPILPWEQITHYTSVDSNVYFICAMTNVQEITIEHSSPATMHFGGGRTTLAHATHLRVINTNEEVSLPGIFNILDLPVLHTLVLHVPENFGFTGYDWVPTEDKLPGSIINLSISGVATLKKKNINMHCRLLLQRLPEVQVLHIEGENMGCIIKYLHTHNMLMHLRDIRLTVTKDDLDTKSLKRLVKLCKRAAMKVVTFQCPAYITKAAKKMWKVDIMQMVEPAFSVPILGGVEVLFDTDGQNSM